MKIDKDVKTIIMAFSLLLFLLAVFILRQEAYWKKEKEKAKQEQKTEGAKK